MKHPLDEGGYARLAAKLLTEEEQPPVVGSVIGDRAAAIGVIERALRSRRRARQLWISASAVGSVAAVVVSVIWLASRTTETLARPHETPRPERDAPMASRGGMLTITGGPGTGTRVNPGTSLQAAADGDLVASLDSGTRVRVAAGGRTRVAELGAMQRFVLEAGAFEAKVAKLEAGHRFIVVTPDAEVEVRGTKFEVALEAEPSACAPHVRTRVMVREGVVVVRHAQGETRVAAESGWPSCAQHAELRAVVARPPSSLPRPTPSREVRNRSKGSEVQSTAKTEVRAAGYVQPSSTLSEQNDLFAAALAARRRGDVDEALRWLDRLVARYPNGQLVESARDERQRLAAGTRQAGPSE